MRRRHATEYVQGARLFIAAAAQEAGVGQLGVDHQRPGGIVLADLEADPAFARRGGQEEVAAGDGLLQAVPFLVDERRFLEQRPQRRLQRQRAVRLEADPGQPIVGHLDAPGVGAGGQAELALEPALASAIDQVHAGVQLPVDHGLVGGHVGTPGGGVIAAVKVGRARQRRQALDYGMRVGAGEAQVYHGGPGGRRAQDDLVRGKKDGVPRALDGEAHGGVFLAGVGDKAQGQVGEGRSGFRPRVGGQGSRVGRGGGRRGRQVRARRIDQ